MTVVVRYETLTEAADENQRLVEQVFAQLRGERPADLRYQVFRLADGVTFVHVAEGDGLPRLTAFQEFQRGIGDRVAAPPALSEASLVGSYTSGPAKAVAYIEAFGKRDVAALAGFLADDVVFESPRVRIAGAEAVLRALSEFPVTGVTIVDALGDDDRAMVMYDMETGPFGVRRAVDHLVFRDGLITSDVVVFDTP